RMDIPGKLTKSRDIVQRGFTIVDGRCLAPMLLQSVPVTIFGSLTQCFETDSPVRRFTGQFQGTAEIEACAPYPAVVALLALDPVASTGTGEPAYEILLGTIGIGQHAGVVTDVMVHIQAQRPEVLLRAVALHARILSLRI